MLVPWLHQNISQMQPNVCYSKQCFCDIIIYVCMCPPSPMVCVFVCSFWDINLGFHACMKDIHSRLSYSLVLFVQCLLLLYVWKRFPKVKYKQNLQRSQACAERQTSRVPSSSWQQLSEVNKSTHIHLNTAVLSRHERKLIHLASIVFLWVCVHICTYMPKQVCTNIFVGHKTTLGVIC